MLDLEASYFHSVRGAEEYVSLLAQIANANSLVDLEKKLKLEREDFYNRMQRPVNYENFKWCMGRVQFLIELFESELGRKAE